MARSSISSGPGVEVPIPADQRPYYLRPYTITRLHGRGRKGKARAAKHLHGRGRHNSERRAVDPWHHQGVGKGQ